MNHLIHFLHLQGFRNTQSFNSMCQVYLLATNDFTIYRHHRHSEQALKYQGYYIDQISASKVYTYIFTIPF